MSTFDESVSRYDGTAFGPKGDVYGMAIRGILRPGMLIWATWIAASVVCPAEAELYINEVYFNPGGQANDERDEYIELRGTPNMPLTDHYLIALENELDEVGAGNAGIIENIFDLGNDSIGSNGFLLLRQLDTRYASVNIAPGTADLVNMGTGSGFGSGETSSIGHSDDNNAGQLSNSGTTMMLIYNHGGLSPTLGFDLDDGNDGLDNRPGSPQAPLGEWDEKWTILDSVGFFAEPNHTEFGRLYGEVNFGSFDPNFPFGPEWEPNIEPDADWEILPHEIEYLGRWGNSTGQTVDDWHVSNLTDSFGAGYIFNTFLLRQSCRDVEGSCHPPNDLDINTPAPPVMPVESNKNVPYGTIITGTLGSPNYLTGDYNKDGVVDAADYTTWRDTLGQTGSEYVQGESPLIHNHPRADGNHDFLVSQADYDIWAESFGAPFVGGAGGGPAAVAVPEPAGWLLPAILVPTLCVGMRVRDARRRLVGGAPRSGW
jgi:hypothetical protein